MTALAVSLETVIRPEQPKQAAWNIIKASCSRRHIMSDIWYVPVCWHTHCIVWQWINGEDQHVGRCRSIRLALFCFLSWHQQRVCVQFTWQSANSHTAVSKRTLQSELLFSELYDTTNRCLWTGSKWKLRSGWKDNVECSSGSWFVRVAAGHLLNKMQVQVKVLL